MNEIWLSLVKKGASRDRLPARLLDIMEKYGEVDAVFNTSIAADGFNVILNWEILLGNQLMLLRF